LSIAGTLLLFSGSCNKVHFTTALGYASVAGMTVTGMCPSPPLLIPAQWGGELCNIMQFQPGKLHLEPHGVCWVCPV
jgi:hypothetical protein